MKFFKSLKTIFYLKRNFTLEILNNDINRMQEKPYDVAFHLENFLVAIQYKRVNPEVIQKTIEVLIKEIKISTCDLKKILNLLTKESTEWKGLESSIELLKKSVTDTEKSRNIIPTR